VTVARSPRSAWVPHELVLNRAPANVRGVECGFLKEVNRPSPEADRHYLLVSTLRMRVRGAVPKLSQYVFIEWCSISLITTFCTSLPPVGKSVRIILYSLLHILVLSLRSLTFLFNSNYLSILSLSSLPIP
jgi:hypothetical protein